MLWNGMFKRFTSLRPPAPSCSAAARGLAARTALAAVIAASLALAGHYQVQRTLDRQGQDRAIAGIAGRQRILGQRIAKSALLIQAAPPGPHRLHLAIELRQLLDLWSRYQLALSRGDEELAIPAEQSLALDTMYSDLHPAYVAIDSIGRILVDAGRRAADGEDDTRSLNKAAEDMHRFERRFLEGMDRIVHQYEAESRAQTAQLRWMERVLLALALAALPLAGWWIVWPAARQLQRDAQELAELHNLVARLPVPRERAARGEPVASTAAEVQQTAAGRDRSKRAQATDRFERRLKQPAAGAVRDLRQAAAVA